jgi:cysteine desulfurase
VPLSAAPSPPPGYLDSASTEPLHPAARDALVAAWDLAWADPARLYGPARRARLMLDEARESVASLLACRPDEVSFTGSGTRAVHLAVAGLASGRRRTGRHAVASAVEHSSVLHALELLESNGNACTLVGVDSLGRVDVESFVAALRPDSAFACLQTANHEVGTTQPVEDVAAACRSAAVPLLVDAAQSIGHGPVPPGWSVLTASAHKWGGPAGVGVLAIRTGVRWRSPSPADDRSGGRVPGFENVPAIHAAAVALQAVTASAPAEDARLRELTHRIRESVTTSVPDAVVVGDPDRRVPHLVTFSCLYVEGEALLRELDRAGFAVSSGSSCTSSTLEPSHVLVAMGALTHGNIRVSLPRGVATSDVDRFLAVLPVAVRQVRDELGAGQP